ncbi:MAG: response regulator [Gammaproteobacteria bacterium]|jgi:DNA-binding response OmpR family regulator|nr:response regulator [Gammaproteobacteria bacterium]
MDGKRVLIVEDEALLALEIGAILRDCGMTPVGPISRNDDALRLIDSQAIDCAVLDVNLQGESTERVAVALASRAIPFAFVTGYGRADIPKQFHEAPVLLKPFAGAALIDTLRALSRHEN